MGNSTISVRIIKRKKIILHFNGGDSYLSHPDFTLITSEVLTLEETILKNILMTGISLTSDERNLLLADSEFSSEVQKFLEENKTIEAREFAEEAIQLKMNLPSFKIDIAESYKSPYNVDLSKVEPNFNNPEPEKEKFMYIYKKVRDIPFFKNIFLETFNDDDRLNVSFEIVDSIPSDDPDSEPNGITKVMAGSTNPTTGNILNVDLVIRINKKNLVGPDRKSLISIAKTILHESVHPYLIIKQLNSDTGATLTSINNKDLGELINDRYNSFNSDEDQHWFMYDKLLPVLALNLSYLKNELIPANHQEVAESLNFESSLNVPPIPYTPFNWDDLFLYLSMGGLERTEVMIKDVKSDPIKNYIYQRYLEVGEDSFRKDL